MLTDVNKAYHLVNPERFWSCASVNGTLHWVAYDTKSNGDYSNKVLVFDVGTEVFTHFDLPTQIEPSDLSVIEYGDTISIVWSPNLSLYFLCKRCAVWVMGDYGDASTWSEKFTVNIEGGISAVLGFGPNEEFYLDNRDGFLVRYDPKRGEAMDLAVLGGMDSFVVGNYQETLVLLVGGVSDNTEGAGGKNDGRDGLRVNPVILMLDTLMLGGLPPRGIRNKVLFDYRKHAEIRHMLSLELLNQ